MKAGDKIAGDLYTKTGKNVFYDLLDFLTETKEDFTELYNNFIYINNKITETKKTENNFKELVKLKLNLLNLKQKFYKIYNNLNVIAKSYLKLVENNKIRKEDIEDIKEFEYVYKNISKKLINVINYYNFVEREEEALQEL